MAGQHLAKLMTTLTLLLLPTAALSQGTGPEAFFEHLSWRHIGPAVFGGRIPDVEADPRNPAVIYVAGSTGGIFKTTNNGVTWEPIFDDAGPTLSIGDMALAPSDPLIIWVGTGEANGEQQAASLGDGVYRSLDGGKTWDLDQEIILRDIANQSFEFFRFCMNIVAIERYSTLFGFHFTVHDIEQC